MLIYHFAFFILLFKFSEALMPLEKSAGAVVFRLQPVRHPGEKTKIYYLLLHYPALIRPVRTNGFRTLIRPVRTDGFRTLIRSVRTNGFRTGSRTSKDFWDFPKGHIEKGEKEIDTVRREVEEETGLKDIRFVEGFKEWIKYFFKHKEKTIFKTVTFYLAEAKTKKIKISYEHIDFKWLPYQKALKQLTFENAKEILKKANNFLIEWTKERD